jgi:hypothetical protein
VNPGVTRLAIVVALVVGGIAVLANGFSGGETQAAPPTTSEPSPSESPSPTESPGDGEIVARQEGVLVQVLNGTFRPGLAADFQTTLEEQGGYVHAGDPADAPEKPIVDTVVYFRPDDDARQNEADAELLSKTYLGDAPVERLPATYKPQSVTDPAADVIVVLGEDMAGAP